MSTSGGTASPGIGLAVPNGARTHSFARASAISALATAVVATGRLRLTYLPVLPGMLISQLSAYTGVAAAGTTNLWFSLYDLAMNKLAVTNDDGATGFPINSEKKLALTAPYRVPDNVFGLYAGICFVGVTPPQLAGAGMQPAVGILGPALSGLATQVGLTDPASAPAIAGGPLDNASAGVPYIAAW